VNNILEMIIQQYEFGGSATQTWWHTAHAKQ